MRKNFIFMFSIISLAISQTNYSAIFDGVDDSILVNHNNSLNFGTGDFSIELFLATVVACASLWQGSCLVGLDGNNVLVPAMAGHDL